jgi:hypothetical protein
MSTNSNQTSSAQSSTQSPQSQNNQSSFENLIKYSREISPLTAEILKVISILSIFFIGLGFMDFLFYANRQGIPLSLSFLTASNMEILIILPILLSLFIFILPYFLSLTLYLSLEAINDNKIDMVFISIYILVIGFVFLFLFSTLYKFGNGNFILLIFCIIYIVLMILISFFYEFKLKEHKPIHKSNYIFYIIWNYIRKEHKSIQPIHKSYFYYLFSVIWEKCKLLFKSSFIYLFIIPIVLIILDFTNNKKSNYLLIISAFYYLFMVMPFQFDIYKHFNKDLSKNKNFYFILTIFSITMIFISLGWIVLKKPSFPFKMLKIGGNIHIHLLISQKYFKELTNQKVLNTKNILKWHSFKLLLKTPDSYYVKNKKIKNLLIIPAKFVYAKSYKKIETKTTNKNNNQFYSNKYLTCLELLLKLNNCIPCADYNKQYCWQYKYGYLIK